MEQSKSIDSLRLSVVQALINTSNVNLLERTMELIREESVSQQTVGYRPNGDPISLSQLEQDILTSREQFKKGEGISIDELEEESKSWV